jgi:hypothetical protein
VLDIVSPRKASMKKKIVALFPAVLLLAMFAQASVVVEKGIFFGVGLSGFSGAGTSGVWSNKTGMMGGFSLSFAFTDYFALQTELYFVQKGAINQVTGTGGILKNTMDIGVLEIPLLAKLSLPLGELRFRPYVLGGASYGFKLWANLSTVLDDGSGYETQVGDANVTGMKRGSPSYILGAGGDFLAPNSRLNVELRYTRSFGSVLTAGMPVYSSIVYLLVGYFF